MLETSDMRRLQKLLRRVFAAVKKDRARKEEVRGEEEKQVFETDCTPKGTARGTASSHQDGDAAPAQDSVEKEEADVVFNRVQKAELSQGNTLFEDQPDILGDDADEFDSGNDSDEDLVQGVHEIRLELESRQKDGSDKYISRGPGHFSLGHRPQGPGAQIRPSSALTYDSQHVIGFHSGPAADTASDTAAHYPSNHGLSDVQDVAEEVLNDFLRNNVSDELAILTEEDCEVLKVIVGDADMDVSEYATAAPSYSGNAPTSLAGQITHVGNQWTVNTNFFGWSSTSPSASHPQPAHPPPLGVPSLQIRNVPLTESLLLSATTPMASNALWPSTASSAASRLLPAPTASSTPRAPRASAPRRASPAGKKHHREMLERIAMARRGRRPSTNANRKVRETYGYNGPEGETDLIKLLKEAEITQKPQFDKIYEAARFYLSPYPEQPERHGHIALMYERDSHGFTALYYAARLGRDHPMIAGFIAECLAEAEERCRLIPHGRKYKLTEERYSQGDNIFHCLARWHSATNHLVYTASVLRQIGDGQLESLLSKVNAEGKLPRELCQPSDSDMRCILMEPRYSSH